MITIIERQELHALYQAAMEINPRTPGATEVIQQYLAFVLDLACGKTQDIRGKINHFVGLYRTMIRHQLLAMVDPKPAVAEIHALSALVRARVDKIYDEAMKMDSADPQTLKILELCAKLRACPNDPAIGAWYHELKVLTEE